MGIVTQRTTFPAIRCIMSNWIYYLTYMRFYDIIEWFKEPELIYKNKISRSITQQKSPKRSDIIAKYLVEKNEYFLNSIVAGVYGGTPQWYPIEIGNSPILDAPDLDDDSKNAIGLLVFDGNEKMFAIYGQYKVDGIKQALIKRSNLAGEEQSVIFIAHDENNEERTRNLIIALNKY